MNAVETDADAVPIDQQLDMARVLNSPDGSQQPVNIASLLDMVREVRDAYQLRMSVLLHVEKGSGSPLSLYRYMRALQTTPGMDDRLNVLGGELRRRCSHDGCWRHGYCTACEANQAFFSPAGLAARKLQRDGFPVDYWSHLLQTWRDAKALIATWDPPELAIRFRPKTKRTKWGLVRTWR